MSYSERLPPLWFRKGTRVWVADLDDLYTQGWYFDYDDK